MASINDPWYNAFGTLATSAASTTTSKSTPYFTQNLPSYITKEIFFHINHLFDLELPTEKIEFLTDLYNTGDEANKKIATSVFHSLIVKQANKEE